MEAAQAASQRPVHLFRERTVDVACPQTGFNMAHRRPGVKSGQRRGKCGRRISLYENHVRLLFGKNPLQTS